jgi:DnaJ homolog subfamily B member 13
MPQEDQSFAKSSRYLIQVLNDDGVTTRSVEIILTIEIGAGTKPKTKIIFPREGDQGPNTIPADLVFVVKEEPHERFQREGNDLILTQEVSLANSLMGVAIDVQTLDGRLLKIPVNDTIG